MYLCVDVFEHDVYLLWEPSHFQMNPCDLSWVPGTVMTNSVHDNLECTRCLGLLSW